MLAAAEFSVGDGPILLDNLECLGFERTLIECSHGGWTVHNCAHSEDAGAVCLPAVPGYAQSLVYVTVLMNQYK